MLEHPQFRALVFLAAFVTTSIGTAFAATSQWYANTNTYPDASCPWVLFDTASPEDPALVQSYKLNLSTSAASENLYYEQTSSLAIPDTLRISARFRVVSESHLAGNPRRGVAIAFAVAPDSANFLWVGRDTVFLWASFAQQGPTAFVDTDDAFHTYQINVMNRTTVMVTQDGVPILTGSIVGTGGNITAPTLWWGDGTGSSFAASEWAFVVHNAGTAACGTAASPPGMSVSSSGATEGNAGTNNMTFFVSLSHPTDANASVSYGTQDVDAIAGEDYVSASGTLTIPALATSAPVNVTVLGDMDTTDCDVETFKLVLSNPVGATLVGSVGVGSIHDDDGPPQPQYWLGPAPRLAWDDCSGSSLTVFNCASSSGTPFTMVASFIAPPGIAELVQMEAELEIISSAPALPSWWQLGTNGCRTGALTASFDFTGGPSSCSDYWQGGAFGGSAYEADFGGPGRARLRVFAQLPNGSPRIGPLLEGSEYYAFKININRTKTTGAGSCAGCSTPVAIVLRSIKLIQPAARAYDPVLINPTNSNTIRWQGGSPGPFPAGNFSINDVTVSEDASQAVFTVTRTTLIDARVHYVTSDGSATAGSDYNSTKGTIVFPYGVDSMTVAVPLINDAVPEAAEIFFVDLYCPTGDIADGHGQATLTDDILGVPASSLPNVANLILEPVRPNPGRGDVVIPFGLPHPGHVSLWIYDVAGRSVRKLVDGTREAGVFQARWDGSRADGMRAAPGVYTCELRAQGTRLTRQFIVVQ